MSSFSVFAQKTYTDEGMASYYPLNRNPPYTRNGESFDQNAMEAGHSELPYGSVVRVTNLSNGKVAVMRINDRPYSHERVMDMTQSAADALGLTDKLYEAKVRVELLSSSVARRSNGRYDDLDTGKVTGASDATKLPPPDIIVIGEDAPPKSAKKEAEKKETEKKTIEKEKTNVEGLEKNFAPVSTYLASGKKAKPEGFGVQIGGFTEIEKALEEARKAEKLQKEPVYVQSGWFQGKKFYRVLVGEYPAEEACRKTIENLAKVGYKGTFAKPHFKI